MLLEISGKARQRISEFHTKHPRRDYLKVCSKSGREEVSSVQCEDGNS